VFAIKRAFQFAAIGRGDVAISEAQSCNRTAETLGGSSVPNTSVSNLPRNTSTGAILTGFALQWTIMALKINWHRGWGP
jgi:hypothetical protein